MDNARKGFVLIIIFLILISGLVLYFKYSQNPRESDPQPIFRVQFNPIDDPLEVGHYKIHTSFAENYSGIDLTVELRDNLIEDLMFQVGFEGYDNSSLIKAFKVIYSNWTERPHRIPCCVTYVLEGQNITQIGIAFNRAFWFDEIHLYQEDIFVFSGVLLDEYTVQECLQYYDMDLYRSPPNPVIFYWGVRD